MLALITYYLLPEGHFLTEYTFSTPTVGLDTKKLFARALLHFLQRLEENMNKIWCRSRELERVAHPLTNVGNRAQPGRAGFYPFLYPWVSSWRCLRSLNQDFCRHPLTFWVFLMHELRLRPQGPVCHLQRSHQHRLQECNNRYSGTQPPQPLLSVLGWERENCSRVFSGCQRAKEKLITTYAALP